MTRSEILSEYGISDKPPFSVMPVPEAGVLWWVGIAGTGDPLKGITPKKAAELALKLQGIGEDELSHRISKTAEDVQRSNAKGASS